jgi:hypothetical protein
MKSEVLSGLLAGFIAGFIWMAVTVLAGPYDKGAIVGGGLGFVVGTAIVTMIVSTVIRRSRRSQ